MDNFEFLDITSFYHAGLDNEVKDGLQNSAF